MSSVSLVHAPQDAGTADYLANDLARQGLSVARGLGTSGPVILVLGPASAGDPGLLSAAAQAAEARRPIHVVRLGDARFDWPSLQQVVSWTDAYGHAAQANVIALAGMLREAGGAAASPWAAPPPAAPSIWANPPASPSPLSVEPSRPTPPPLPIGSQEPSDRGSLIALGVIGTLGLVLLILYFTGVLGAQTNQPGTAPTPGTPVTTGTTGAVTDQWLTGTWKENCAASEFIRFDLAAGTATFHNGGGRVRRNGNTLTITGAGGSIVMTVAYQAQDRMLATAQGDSQTLYRCG